MSRYFYSTRGSTPAGPVTVSELEELIRAGHVTSETAVCEEGSNAGWISIAQLSPPNQSGAATSAARTENTEMVPAQSTTEVSGDTRRSYQVIVLTTGCFTKTLDPARLQRVLNQNAAKGWRFSKSIHEEQRILFVFQREAHFLIFEKDT